VVAQEVIEPNLGDERPLVINLPAGSCTSNTVQGLKDVLASHPGTTQVFLHLVTTIKTTVFRLGSEFYVDTHNGLHAELKALLGPNAVITI
jgi:DNA polymerase III subunit alpha